MEYIAMWILFLSLGEISYGSSADDGVAEALYVSTTNVYVQKGQTRHVRCPSWRPEERLNLAYWDKGEQLITRFAASPQVGTNYTLSERFSVSSTFGLVIKFVEADDGGDYLCTVSSTTGTHRQRKVSIKVLDTQFPSADDNYISAETRLERGQEHTLSCPLLTKNTTTESSTRTAATIYWTLDIGQPNYTNIIAAKYSDGLTKVTGGFNRDYRVTIDGRLIINDLEGSRMTLWCFLFQDQQIMTTAYVDVVGIVFAMQEFPSISTCDVGDAICDVSIGDKDLALNCSVTDIYPEVQLTWEPSTPGCNFATSRSFVVFDNVSETFEQFTELLLPADAPILNCTFMCVAAGFAIRKFQITKTIVIVTDKSPALYWNIIIIIIVLLGLASCTLPVLSMCLFWRRRRQKQGTNCKHKDDEELSVHNCHVEETEVNSCLSEEKTVTSVPIVSEQADETVSHPAQGMSSGSNKYIQSVVRIETMNVHTHKHGKRQRRWNWGRFRPPPIKYSGLSPPSVPHKSEIKKPQSQPSEKDTSTSVTLLMEPELLSETPQAVKVGDTSNIEPEITPDSTPDVKPVVRANNLTGITPDVTPVAKPDLTLRAEPALTANNYPPGTTFSVTQVAKAEGKPGSKPGTSPGINPGVTVSTPAESTRKENDLEDLRKQSSKASESKENENKRLEATNSAPSSHNGDTAKVASLEKGQPRTSVKEGNNYSTSVPDESPENQPLSPHNRVSTNKPYILPGKFLFQSQGTADVVLPLRNTPSEPQIDEKPIRHDPNAGKVAAQLSCNVEGKPVPTKTTSNDQSGAQKSIDQQPTQSPVLHLNSHSNTDSASSLGASGESEHPVTNVEESVSEQQSAPRLENSPASSNEMAPSDLEPQNEAASSILPNEFSSAHVSTIPSPEVTVVSKPTQNIVSPQTNLVELSCHDNQPVVDETNRLNDTPSTSPQDFTGISSNTHEIHPSLNKESYPLIDSSEPGRSYQVPRSDDEDMKSDSGVSDEDGHEYIEMAATADDEMPSTQGHGENMEAEEDNEEENLIKRPETDQVDDVEMEEGDEPEEVIQRPDTTRKQRVLTQRQQEFKKLNPLKTDNLRMKRPRNTKR